MCEVEVVDPSLLFFWPLAHAWEPVPFPCVNLLPHL